jgi:hypothetical protein
MFKASKGIAIAVFVFVILAVVGITATVGWRPFIGPKKRALTDRRFEATPERLKRGDYLAEHVAGCTVCHTPQEETPNGPEVIASKKGSGQVFSIPGLPGTLVAPNITPDRETGIGNFTMRTGYLGKRQLSTVMPWQFYSGQTDEDLKAMYAYLRTVPAVSHRVDNTKAPTACKKCGEKHGADDAN